MSDTKNVGTITKDGYTGTVYSTVKNVVDADGKAQQVTSEFVAWHLATFSSARGDALRITATTGRNGRPKAAAYNLGGGNDFLQRCLAARIQFGDTAGGVRAHIPGAQLLGVGYEEPLELKLEAYVDDSSRKNRELAARILTEKVTLRTAKGVYAMYSQMEKAAKGAEPASDLGTIEDAGSELQF